MLRASQKIHTTIQIRSNKYARTASDYDEEEEADDVRTEGRAFDLLRSLRLADFD